MRKRLLALLFILLAAPAVLGEQVPQPLPGTFVHDFAGVIPADREAEIQAKAQRLRDEYKTEIAVVTVDSLQGEESFDYSLRMARAWGIGSKDNDVRGLLVLVAVRDRKTAFRTSRHVEGELPDGVTGAISREMNVYFKQGDFGGGLSLGMDRILERLKAVYEPQPDAAQTVPARPGFSLGWLWLPVIGIPSLGLGYLVLRGRSRKRREAEEAPKARASGFRAWATKTDPTPVPKVKYKRPSQTKSTHSRASGKKKASSSGTYQSPGYGSESSDYGSSSSSYDSSSSSGSDSGSSYSGGSDFGGGGSDSSW